MISLNLSIRLSRRLFSLYTFFFFFISLFRFYFLHRKEVIHPLVLAVIPCFDLTPITSTALDAALLTVELTLLGLTGSHGVTGSVYKARERIHRSDADLRLLAIPAS